MRVTYAVTWQKADEDMRSGRLELRPRGLAFEGLGGNGSASELVDYDALSTVRIARSSGERLLGRPTLVLDYRTGDHLRIASVAQPGIISELAEHLAALHLGEERALGRLVVVVPLKDGASERAAALVEHGPPFDPDEAGLDRHQVFVTEHEAVFIFEAEAADALERLAGDTAWAAASAWEDLVAGPPRLTEGIYFWQREYPDEGISFASTPGPGDSDGGDVFSP